MTVTTTTHLRYGKLVGKSNAFPKTGVVFGPGGRSLSLLPMVRNLRPSRAVSTRHMAATSTVFIVSSIFIVVVGDIQVERSNHSGPLFRAPTFRSLTERVRRACGQSPYPPNAILSYVAADVNQVNGNLLIILP